jgi:hypothetical protein
METTNTTAPKPTEPYDVKMRTIPLRIKPKGQPAPQNADAEDPFEEAGDAQADSPPRARVRVHPSERVIRELGKCSVEEIDAVAYHLAIYRPALAHFLHASLENCARTIAAERNRQLEASARAAQRATNDPPSETSGQARVH